MKIIFALFLFWRVMLFLIASNSPTLFPNFAARFPYYQERLVESGLPHYIWAFGNFDGVHYLGIASSGYSAQFTQAFFPLYPILIGLLSLLFAAFSLGLKASLLLSGLVISNTAFLVALCFFYKMIKEKFNKNIALWSSIFLIFSPTSFFFGSIYAESLILLSVVSAFYYAEKNKIFLASIIGSFGSAAKLVGVFLAVTLTFKKFPLKPLLIIPLGIFAYSLYLQFKFNNFLYFLNAQSAFGQERATSAIILPPQVVFRYIKILLTTSDIGTFNSALELIFTSIAFLLLILGFKIKKMKREWLAFSILALITPTLTGTLASMPRYILIAFPIYVVLALIKNSYLKLSILLLFFITLVLLTSLFSQGYWVA